MGQEGRCQIGNHRPAEGDENRRASGNGTYLSRNDESDRFDGRRVKFISTGNFALGYVERATRQEAHSTLRIRRLVLGKGEQIIVLIFIVTNIAIANFARDLVEAREDAKGTDPFPARNRMLLSDQKGMTTPAD